MELRHVQTFVTVADLGTVTKAALRLRIAQPALSRQISDLEQELGIRLFDRVGRRLLLSSEGEQLLGDCRDLLNHARALGERAHLLRRGDTGVLRVAASPHHIESVFACFLHHYAQRYPNVRVKLVDAVGPEMLLMLERGEIHLGQSLVNAIPAEDQRFASHPLEPTEVLAACHPSLDLGKRRSIEIVRLAPYPLLLLHPEFLIRRTFDAACRLAGLKPNIMLESRAPHTLLALAEAAHGVAIIPSAVRANCNVLRILRVTYEGKPLREPMTILSDRRRPLPPYAVAFCEMLAKHVREIFPITKPSEPRVRATVKRQRNHE